jgi:enterochelin esterase-like enzyme
MVEDWIQRARQGAPLIDGEEVTFVWQGPRAPLLIGDFAGWEQGALPLTAVAPEVWVRTLTFPRDAYLEYAYLDGGERVADPLNRRTTPDGFGHRNHYFYMPEGRPTPLLRRRRAIGHGTVIRHTLEDRFLLVGGRRTVHLYRPPVEGPCPLLVVLDGQDYRRRGKLVNIVDNLIAAGRIQPLAMALVDHGGQHARGVEYTCGEAHLGVLLERVLPLARQELNLLDVEKHPGQYGILGASMGGLQALYTAVRLPHLFGRVLSQSGAFALGGYEPVLWDLVRHKPVPALQVWLDVGRYEWLLECNRRMHDLLAEKGTRIGYREYNAGHNYPAWRNQVEHGLEWLFAPLPKAA